MSILFDKTLGLLQAGMTVRRTHQSVTAGNIANADTPGYRAHRADFGDVLARARHRVDGPQMDRTHPAGFGKVRRVRVGNFRCSW